MKNIIIIAALFLTGCVFIVPEKHKQEQPKDCANPEGPWYSEQFLKENPQYVSDIYLCSNYYKHQYVTKHTVPIICGSKDGECGIVNCECVCHK